MRKFLVFLLVFVVAGFVVQAQKLPTTPNGVRIVSGAVVTTSVSYVTSEGYSVILVFNSNTKEIILKIAEGLFGGMVFGKNEKYLDLLKQEVLKLAQPGKTTPLGESGYTFTYAGGYPIWEPLRESGPDGNFTYLPFAKNATMNGKNIRAEGVSKKATGYYGYAK